MYCRSPQRHRTLTPVKRRTFTPCSQETGLYEYKIIGVLSACPAQQCADVYMDLGYRKQWDSYVKGTTS